MLFLQDVIHKIEVAGGVRYIRYTLSFLVAALVLIAYDLRVAKNFGTQEAMDTAQLGRHIAEGQGYTTGYIRPFSMHLLSERNRNQPADPDQKSDPARIRGAHPDIANPPVYPMVLAGLMKALPFRFEVSNAGSFWSKAGNFWRYQPDFLITWFNQLLLLIVILLTYFWARRMFDSTVANLSAIVLFGSEILWRFSASGLSTMLLLLVVLGVVWCLTLWQAEILEPRRGDLWVLSLAALVGLLVGVGGLTRYGVAWLILPTLAFIAWVAGPRRWTFLLIALAGFLVVMAPWLIRNYHVSGTLFGTAGYHVLEGAGPFPGDTLERSLNPDVQFSLRVLGMKLLINARVIFEKEFFTFAGGWMVALFLVSLMVGFRNPILRGLRVFVVSSLAVLFVVQALARTHLSEDVPGINSENFLVLLLPLIVAYAVSLFCLLLDQIEFPVKQLRLLVSGGLVALVYLPLFFALMPPRSAPLVYPPYYPPAVQQAAEMLGKHELMMSDVPWAVAWYGNRPCVQLTLNAMQDPSNTSDTENFFAINDLLKPISGLYLTPKTMDLRFQSDLMRGTPASWGRFVLATLLTKDSQGRSVVAPPFPLREVVPGFLTQQMFLTDWKRPTTSE
ncbi:MAG: hypothetical protein ACTHLW_09625 [Verrucomicrobiota bacterium]